MSCCGQKRIAASATPAAMRTNGTNADRQATHSPAPAKLQQVTVSIERSSPLAARHVLRYTGLFPLSLRGPQSGRVYYFSATGNTAAVDEGDVDALLRTQLFVRDAVNS